MPIERSTERIAARRIAAVARRLLDASTLCAIATVGAGGRPHINTAYFAASPHLEIVWLSEPDAQHSRNLRANPSAAIAVYATTQSWGGQDRGIQLFGPAREAGGRMARGCEDVYAARFQRFRAGDLAGYRFYRLRPRSIKLFDEQEFGGGVFVTATVGSGGRVDWKATQLYRSRHRTMGGA
jgi:uncharacterized protein YhbP (UPF0306 family)